MKTNIFHMLCYAFRILRQQNYMEILTEDFNHVEDMLAAILSHGIAVTVQNPLRWASDTRACFKNGYDLYHFKKTAIAPM